MRGQYWIRRIIYSVGGGVAPRVVVGCVVTKRGKEHIGCYATSIVLIAVRVTRKSLPLLEIIPAENTAIFENTYYLFIFVIVGSLKKKKKYFPSNILCFPSLSPVADQVFTTHGR